MLDIYIGAAMHAHVKFQAWIDLIIIMDHVFTCEATLQTCNLR